MKICFLLLAIQFLQSLIYIQFYIKFLFSLAPPTAICVIYECFIGLSTLQLESEHIYECFNRTQHHQPKSEYIYSHLIDYNIFMGVLIDYNTTN